MQEEFGGLGALKHCQTTDPGKLTASKDLIYEKMHNEQIHNYGIYIREQKNLQELEEKCRKAEREIKGASEVADRARESLAKAEEEKLELERVSAERLASILKLKEHIEVLTKEKDTISYQLDKLRTCEQVVKTSSYDMQLDGRQKELNEFSGSAYEKKTNVQMLNDLLTTERQACAKANRRAESLSLELKSMQRKVDVVEKELASVRLNEKVLEAKLKDVLWENAAIVDSATHSWRRDLQAMAPPII